MGIKTRFQPVAWQRYVDVFRGQSKPGARPFIYYIGYGNGTGDSDAALSAIAACKGAWSGYCNPEIDKLLDEAGWTLAEGADFRTNAAGEELARQGFEAQGDRGKAGQVPGRDGGRRARRVRGVTAARTRSYTELSSARWPDPLQSAAR